MMAQLSDTELIENSKVPTTSSPENSVIPNSNQETQESTNPVEPIN